MVNAQQWVEFTQQGRYNMYQNPSLAGKHQKLDAVVAHRSQYVGLSSRAISTQFVGVSTPFTPGGLTGGLRMVNDQIGYQRFTSSELALGYHFGKSDNKIAVGISGGLIQMGLDGSRLRASGGSYNSGAVVHNDEFLPDFKVGALSPTFTAGVTYYTNKFELGAAVQNINSPNLQFDNFSSGTFVQIGRTINIHTNYVISISKVNLVPSFFYKTDLVKHQILSNLMLETQNIFFGAAFRGYSGFNNDAVAGLMGFKIKKNLSVAYSYDYNVSALNNSNSGSHEISVRWENLIKFKEKSVGNIMHNPRFL
jgi:type IX secretion system PorP/SprF family membrane protein